MNTIGFKDGFFIYQGRSSEFNLEVTKMTATSSANKKEIAICHHISFKTIAVGIKNALNYYVNVVENGLHEEGIFQSLAFIVGMIYSVKGYQLEDEEIELMNDLETFNQHLLENVAVNEELEPYLFHIERLKEAMFMEDFFDDELRQEILFSFLADEASKIVDLLNNETSNLRVGNRKWNSSLRDAYDPESYVFNKNEFILTDKADCTRISNLIHLTLGGEGGIPETETVLYFLSGSSLSDQKLLWLYSSTFVNMDLIPNKYVEECSYPISYYNYFEKKFIKLQTGE